MVVLVALPTNFESKNKICWEKNNHKFPVDIFILTDYEIQARTPNSKLDNKKKITCHQMEFVES